VLEQVDMTNNKKLDYAKIESRFLKSLPILLESKVRRIDKREFEKVVKKQLDVPGKTQGIHYFST
jgi:hypothetical protein